MNRRGWFKSLVAPLVVAPLAMKLAAEEVAPKELPSTLNPITASGQIWGRLSVEQVDEMLEGAHIVDPVQRITIKNQLLQTGVMDFGEIHKERWNSYDEVQADAWRAFSKHIDKRLRR